MLMNSLKCPTVKKKEDKILKIAFQKTILSMCFYKIFVQFTNFFSFKNSFVTYLSNL